MRSVQEGAEGKRRELEEQISSLADKDKTIKSQMNHEESVIIEQKAQLQDNKAKVRQSLCNTFVKAFYNILGQRHRPHVKCRGKR